MDALTLHSMHTDQGMNVFYLKLQHAGNRLESHVQGPLATVFVQDHGVRSSGGRRVTIAMLLSAEAGDERKHLQQLKARSAA